jgi:hypothetical protein
MYQAATENTSIATGQSLGNSFAQIFMGINTGILAPLPNREQWVRNTRLVAKLPKGPF